MGARRRRAHRELVGLERGTPADEEFASYARGKRSANLAARSRATSKESQRELAVLAALGAFVVLAVLFFLGGRLEG